MIGWQTALRDGALLSALASALVMATLRLNPRLLLRHYPPELRAAVPPNTPRERMISRLVGLPLIALLVGVPAWSTAAWQAAIGEQAFGQLWLHAFIVGSVFNLVDWLVLDELWLGVVRPRWAMLPGAEDVPFQFNHGQHLRGFVVGCVIFAASSAAIAGWLSR